ncbi:hypothetical protein ACOII5_003618 [Cronobacter dublinensis]
MTDITAESQQQIFHQPLEGAELDAVNGLVRQHKANAALTQQLALDASKLIASSQERLQKQSSSGFFKRFACAVTGKNTENQLQNQADTLQMQKFAWHYLQQLQQQNLINAQSIALIRNNLGTMNEYLIETRDFLEEAIDRINQRLVHVENNTSFSKWSLNIEANKRRYKSLPGTILVLSLTYDFMRTHQNIALKASDINHLIVTLENLGVNCDEEVRLLDFILDLIDQIEIVGIDRYRSMIALAVDEHQIDSHFIQNNISGIAFNALYFLSEQYEKILSLTEDDTLCMNDEAREKLISRFFGEAFSGLSTTYSLRDLLSEALGGSLLTMDIYKDVNGLNVSAYDEHTADDSAALTLVSALPDIHHHSFFDATESAEEKRQYLLLLALCVENAAALSREGQEFLALLSEKAGCPAVMDELITLADNSVKFQAHQQTLLDVLKDDDARYTWLFDAFFLLARCNKPMENPQVMRLLGMLKPAQFKDNFSHIQTLLKESDETSLLESAAKLNAFTHGWKNIVRYRERHFHHYYDETIKQLYAADSAAMRLSLELMKVTDKASDYGWYMGSFENDGFLSKMGSAVGSSAYAIGRKSCLSSLNEFRKKAEAFLSANAAPFHTANRMTARWGLPVFAYEDRLGYGDYELDNSTDNDDWYNQFSEYEQRIDGTLTAFSTACSDAADQLERFAKGEFDQSVIRLKAQKHAEWLLQQEQEKQNKQSVSVSKEGETYRLSIDWQDISNPPCEPENIRHIKTDGRIWLIVDSDNRLYRSEDTQSWQHVTLNSTGDTPYITKILLVEHTWIIFAGYDPGFYYSSDALQWAQSQHPEVPNTWDYTATEDIVFFNNQWLWRFKERKEYEYKEEGFFFDSTKTSTYDKPLIYCTDQPGAPWRRYDDAPRFSEGVEIERLVALPGVDCLLAFAKYSGYYIMVKKRPEAEPLIEYHMPGKGWRSSTWNGDKVFYSDILTTRMKDKLMCFYSQHLMTSDKGYEWDRHVSELHVANCFHLQDFSLFPSSYKRQLVYISQDGQEFQELLMGEGDWQYLAANEQGVLCVYSPNSHETFLRLGKYNWRRQA